MAGFSWKQLAVIFAVSLAATYAANNFRQIRDIVR